MGLLWHSVFWDSLDAKGPEKNHLKEWLSLPYFQGMNATEVMLK